MFIKSIVLSITLVSCFNCYSKQSQVWEDFKKAKANTTEAILPDFSYVGYKYSEVEIPNVDYKIYDVTEFGATPNDLKSDKEAIKKAVEAATKNGKGIVFFPKGKYLINTEDDDQSIIKITSSQIIFRGEGVANTTLFFDKDLPPADPKKLWTCPSAIQVSTNKKNKTITKVIANAKRETFEVKVDNASTIKKGDWVILEMLNNSKELIAYDIGPMVPEPKWKSILEDGVQVNERHQIASVSGNTVTFREPIHYDVQSKHGWTLSTFEHVSGVGFENILFEGNWKKEFVHHRSAQDDGGWSILRISEAVDSWIKDCTFKNVNNAASFSSSAACTAVNVTIEGTIGHSAIHAEGSTGILMANVHDKAGMHHSIGVAGGSNVATVIWRSTYPAHTCFESHSSQPRCTLFDNVEGGFMKGRGGGAVFNLPTHGRYLVLWNYNEIDEPEFNFDFVDKNSQYWRVVPPIIVGFHGSGTTFNENEVQILESLGKPVQPESLFEEQLKLRLGKLPEWISVLKSKL
jgi:hypothetical protein